MKKDIVTLAKDVCGNQALQALILQTTTEERKHLKIIFTKDIIIPLSTDSNGFYIIKKLAKILDESDREDLYSIFIDDFAILIGNQEGFRLVIFC